MDIQTVLSEIGAWPVEDRLRLMGEIWDGLADQDHQSPLSDELKAELDRRLAELDRSPQAVVSWEAVEARALRRFQQ